MNIIHKIAAAFRPTSVASILSSFESSAKRLDALARSRADESTRKAEEAAALSAEAVEDQNEALRALVAAGKLRAFIA